MKIKADGFHLTLVKEVSPSNPSIDPAADIEVIKEEEEASAIQPPVDDKPLSQPERAKGQPQSKSYYTRIKEAVWGFFSSITGFFNRLWKGRSSI